MVTETKAVTNFAVAIDLGTTTIAASLVELPTLASIRTATLPNPQAKYGKDVISRIETIADNPEGLKLLQGLVTSALSTLIDDLTEGNEQTLKAITHITCAGNSVMEHILHGVSPEPIGRVPYRPVFKEPRSVKAKDIGIDICAEGAVLYTLPIIGGFVGGDAVAALVALGLDTSTADNILAIDIGTNTEIILSAGGKLSATAAAAGPAFEGGEVVSGMAAIEGAISGVRVEDDTIKLDIVGDGNKALGICGSGLISIIAELLKAGVIDESGRIKDSAEVDTNLSSRIHTSKEGNRFTLYRDASSDIAITQADVRALQTAKAAIRAGIETILAKAKINASELKKIFITGAFGSNIDTSALLRIGLLDRAWEDKLQAVNDAALKGAELAISTEGKHRMAEAATKTAYVPLSGTKGFESSFIAHTNFPTNIK